MTLGLACSVILIGLGTNVVLGLVAFFALGHYARTARTLIEENRELSRLLWARETAKDPTGSLAGHLAAATQGPSEPPAQRRMSPLEEDEMALMRSI